MTDRGGRDIWEGEESEESGVGRRGTESIQPSQGAMELPRRRGVLESERGERDKGTLGKMLPNRAGVFDIVWIIGIRGLGKS
jgi:hypothetical protein